MNNTTPAIRCEIDEIAVIGKRKTKRSLIPTFMGLFRVFKKLKDLGQQYKNGILDFLRKNNQMQKIDNDSHRRALQVRELLITCIVPG